MILVTGATGNAGGGVVNGLLELDSSTSSSTGAVDETTVHPAVRTVTGREPRSFEQWAEEHADAFR